MALNSSQYGIISTAILLGRQLQKTNPEITELYISGINHRDIVEKLEIAEKYSVSYSTARCAVQFAVYGHSGEVSEKYLGLIPKSELALITHNHRINRGKLLATKKIGVHGLSKEERQRNGQIGGLLSVIYETGIHKQNSEDKKECARNSQLKQGRTLWSERETYDAFRLSKKIKYHRGSLIYTKLIAEYLNDAYHSGKQVRTAMRVRKKLETCRK